MLTESGSYYCNTKVDGGGCRIGWYRYQQKSLDTAGTVRGMVRSGPFPGRLIIASARQ